MKPQPYVAELYGGPRDGMTVTLEAVTRDIHAHDVDGKLHVYRRQRLTAAGVPPNPIRYAYLEPLDR